MRPLLVLLCVAGLLAGCYNNSPAAIQTAIAQTAAVTRVTAAALAGSPTTARPSVTPPPTNSHQPTATETPPPSATATAEPTDTSTPLPTDTALPTETATPSRTLAPALPSATPTVPPDFVATVKSVRAQVVTFRENLVQAYQNLEDGGAIDCSLVIATRDFVLTHRELNVSPDLAEPYATYQTALTTYFDFNNDLYARCLETPSETHRVLRAQGGPEAETLWAIIGLNQVVSWLAEAITQAGGTP